MGIKPLDEQQELFLEDIDYVSKRKSIGISYFNAFPRFGKSYFLRWLSTYYLNLGKSVGYVVYNQRIAHDIERNNTYKRLHVIPVGRQVRGFEYDVLLVDDIVWTQSLWYNIGKRVDWFDSVVYTTRGLSGLKTFVFRSLFPDRNEITTMETSVEFNYSINDSSRFTPSRKEELKLSLPTELYNSLYLQKTKG